MKKWFLIAAAAGMFFTLSASDNRYFLNSLGQPAGSKSVSNNVTTYRNKDGQITATAHRKGLVTTFRDAGGKVLGTVTESGRTRTCRNADGVVVLTAVQNGLVITFTNAQGKIVGTGTIQPDKTIVYRDADGSITGSKK
jgi:YD repeat-containing protein